MLVNPFPLFSLSLSFGPQLHQDRGHIVATQSLAHTDVLGAALFHQGLTALDQVIQRSLLCIERIVAPVALLVNEVDALLRTHNVPNAVTR